MGIGSVGFEDLGSTTAGLFGLDYSMNLYSVDPLTGTSTLVGPTGLGLSLHGDFSTGSAMLYLLAQYVNFGPTSALYSLNTTTGEATLIGDTPATFGILYDSGKLYGESYTSCSTNAGGICGQSIYTIDPATGSSMLLSNVTGSNPIFDGLAPVPTAIPEPSSLVPFLLTFFLVLGAARRRFYRGRTLQEAGTKPLAE